MRMRRRPSLDEFGGRCRRYGCAGVVRQWDGWNRRRPILHVPRVALLRLPATSREVQQWRSGPANDSLYTHVEPLYSCGLAMVFLWFCKETQNLSTYQGRQWKGLAISNRLDKPDDLIRGISCCWKIEDGQRAAAAAICGVQFGPNAPATTTTASPTILSFTERRRRSISYIGRLENLFFSRTQPSCPFAAPPRRFVGHLVTDGHWITLISTRSESLLLDYNQNYVDMYPIQIESNLAKQNPILNPSY